jgi:hypothetical protein
MIPSAWESFFISTRTRQIDIESGNNDGMTLHTRSEIPILTTSDSKPVTSRLEAFTKPAFHPLSIERLAQKSHLGKTIQVVLVRKDRKQNIT